MYINSLSHYVPKGRVSNDYFLNVNGLTDEWIYSRTGIKTRSKADKSENTNVMAQKACRNAIGDLPYDIKDIDLIVGATYSPYDTVGTLSHVIQREHDISDVIVVSVSSACSSFVNAVEIVEGYFATGKASKALVVASEHNTAYHNPTDEIAGHLWGDGAAAMFISKERIGENEIEIKDIKSLGHANEGRGSEGVRLHPRNGGIAMPYGKDVFVHAVIHMKNRVLEILDKNGYSLNQLKYLAPHQANIRIIDNVGKNLKLEKEQVLVNIDEFGNTGCPSSAIALSQNVDRYKKGDVIVLTAFGGGYSSGAILMEV